MVQLTPVLQLMMKYKYVVLHAVFCNRMPLQVLTTLSMDTTEEVCLKSKLVFSQRRIKIELVFYGAGHQLKLGDLIDKKHPK